MIEFLCAECGVAITRSLEPLAPDAICYSDGKAAIPKGTYARSINDYWTGSEGCFLVNLDDLVDVSYHPDTRRHNGCCGRDGCDGPNRICRNGHEVGTERSDCWMAHAMVLIPTIRWQER